MPVKEDMAFVAISAMPGAAIAEARSALAYV